ncbi:MULTISPECIES: hypothetical protein [unclassified Oceanobacillus]|uniref:hypothetical protein n=1 Tax=unclassified Oceanobacillus TaxID=2630292 RepID=UPI0012ECB5BA|nr:hypothetical protein [Oceanobacillus sp. AG]
MLWEEVRLTYPNKWVVFEAIKAHSDNNYRKIDDIAVIDYFDNSMEALQRHAKLQKEKPRHELYFFHTSRKKLHIQHLLLHE